MARSLNPPKMLVFTGWIWNTLLHSPPPQLPKVLHLTPCVEFILILMVRVKRWPAMCLVSYTMHSIRECHGKWTPVGLWRVLFPLLTNYIAMRSYLGSLKWSNPSVTTKHSGIGSDEVDQQSTVPLAKQYAFHFLDCTSKPRNKL